MTTGPDGLDAGEVDDDQGWRGLIETWTAGLPEVDE
jgi:hypothetical protein